MIVTCALFYLLCCIVPQKNALKMEDLCKIYGKIAQKIDRKRLR